MVARRAKMHFGPMFTGHYSSVNYVESFPKNWPAEGLKALYIIISGHQHGFLGFPADLNLPKLGISLEFYIPFGICMEINHMT